MPILKKAVAANTIIAVAATVTSICALVVAVYQTKLTREQQLNSVWPYLITYESIDENQQLTLMVANYGIGPAIIDSVRVTHNGKFYSTPTDVVKAISKKLNRGEFGLSWSHTGLGGGFVVPQSQTFSWITVNGSSDNAIFRKEANNIKTYIYYHSIYGERWHSILNDGKEMVVKD